MWKAITKIEQWSLQQMQMAIAMYLANNLANSLIEYAKNANDQNSEKHSYILKIEYLCNCNHRNTLLKQL